MKTREQLCRDTCILIMQDVHGNPEFVEKAIASLANDIERLVCSEHSELAFKLANKMAPPKT